MSLTCASSHKPYNCCKTTSHECKCSILFGFIQLGAGNLLPVTSRPPVTALFGFSLEVIGRQGTDKRIDGQMDRQTKCNAQ